VTGVDAAGLFARHHLPVFRFLRRLVGSTDRAEELTQDVFVRVVAALPNYEARDRERAWIFRIARTVLVDDTRRRHARVPDAAGDDLSEAPPARPRQPMRAELDEALAVLPSQEREAFLARELGGLSYDEIASATDSTPDAVRSRIFRARCALREHLAPRAMKAVASGGVRSGHE
jgi:RNA polymerase sigma-70 factor (ECF subfamily)